MLKLIYRLLFEKIYINPGQSECELPRYLSLREIADIPPYHPRDRDRCDR